MNVLTDAGGQISRKLLKQQVLNHHSGFVSSLMSEPGPRLHQRQHFQTETKYTGTRGICHAWLRHCSHLPPIHTCTLLHLAPMYLTSFPLFFSASVRTCTSLSDSIQTSFFGRSISNVSTVGRNNSCFTENCRFCFSPRRFDPPQSATTSSLARQQRFVRLILHLLRDKVASIETVELSDRTLMTQQNESC